MNVVFLLNSVNFRGANYIESIYLPQVMYIHSYPRRKSVLSNPLLLKGWELVFELTKKSDVERELKASRLNYHWKVTAATITKQKETNTHCIYSITYCSAWELHSEMSVSNLHNAHCLLVIAAPQKMTKVRQNTLPCALCMSTVSQL